MTKARQSKTRYSHKKKKDGPPFLGIQDSIHDSDHWIDDIMPLYGHLSVVVHIPSAFLTY